MASLKCPPKSQPRPGRTKLGGPSVHQHPSQPQFQPIVVRRQGDLEFDVRDLLSELRTLTPEEREHLIRSYA